jgi:hypothetical protein
MVTLIPVAWRGEDDPSRHDRAVVGFAAAGMTAHGTSITDDYALAWSLDALDGWCTRELRVSVHGDGWSRTLVLARAADGTWTAEAATRGAPALPAAGIVRPEKIAGADDCDLGLCPVTNTMPIRRLRLQNAEVGPRALIMAMVEVPSLRVVRSEQEYRSVSSDAVGFRSGGFHAVLGVDQDGLVLDYPSLASRVR